MCKILIKCNRVQRTLEYSWFWSVAGNQPFCVCDSIKGISVFLCMSKHEYTIKKYFPLRMGTNALGMPQGKKFHLTHQNYKRMPFKVIEFLFKYFKHQHCTFLKQKTQLETLQASTGNRILPGFLEGKKNQTWVITTCKMHHDSLTLSLNFSTTYVSLCHWSIPVFSAFLLTSLLFIYRCIWHCISLPSSCSLYV